VLSSTTFSNQDAADGDATLNIVREQGLWGGGCSSAIYLDDKVVADMEIGQQLVLHVPSGTRKLSVLAHGACSGERLDADASADAPPTTFRVARYDLATGKTTIVLERKDGMSAEQPRISPDGAHVVYTRFRDDGAASAIFVADLKGGPEHRLTEWELLGAHPDWSIEDLIVFNTRDLAAFQDTTEPANLYTIAVDGSDLRQLTTFGSSATRATQPRWTPDGTGIVFTQVDGSGFGERRLAFINADGSGRDWLTPSPLAGTHPQLRPLADSG